MNEKNIAYQSREHGSTNLKKVIQLLTVSLLGLVMVGCSQNVLATRSPDSIEVTLSLESDGDVRIDPDMMQNTVLSVTGEDGRITNLSDNLKIPLTYTYADFDPRSLDKLKFATFLYVQYQGYTDWKDCEWDEKMMRVLAPGTFVKTLVCGNE